MQVNLTYFRTYGKYETTGTYDTTCEHMYQIFQAVDTMAHEQRLPGLVEGHSPYIVHVDCPQHPRNYPALVIPLSRPFAAAACGQAQGREVQ